MRYSACAAGCASDPFSSASGARPPREPSTIRNYKLQVGSDGYSIQIWHDGGLMYVMYIYAHFDDFDLDARLQWLGRGKHYLSCGIQTACDCTRA